MLTHRTLPRLPDRFGLKILRIMRDDELIENIEHQVGEFLEGVGNKIRELDKRYG